MNKPHLTMALALYDRHVPFFDGTAMVNDVDLQVLAVGEANSLRDGGRRHHRMLMNLEFDACEVSLSSYIIARHHGLPIIAIPVFPRRLFTQSNVWVNRDTGIRTPKELIGRKVGLITFQTTVSVQAKGDLQAEYGVPWRDIEWYVAAEEPIEFSIPDSLILKRIPQGKRLGEMLETGFLDAVITPRAPVSVVGSTATIRRLFPMAQDEECRYFRKHAFFPAMHVVALKEETVQKYPWVPAALVRAFRQAHEICRSYYTDPNWTVHAWTQHLFEEEQNRLGLNLWPIGIEENRPNIELFMQYLMDQGLVAQKIPLEKLFVDGSHDGK